MINTLRMSEELEKVGFTKDQAYKTVDTWMSIIDENLVTKSDMKELQYSVKSDVKDLRTDFEKQFKELKSELEKQKREILIKLGSLMVTLFTIYTTIISYLIIKY